MSPKKKRKSSIYKPVPIQDKNGCVISALACVTGRSYKEVLKGLEPFWLLRGKHEGVDDCTAYQYLATQGFAVQVLEEDYAPLDKRWKVWPPEPFAPVHLALVNAGEMHMIVVDEVGTVIDPGSPKKTKLTDYHRVYSVAGIWEVDVRLDP